MAEKTGEKIDIKSIGRAMVLDSPLIHIFEDSRGMYVVQKPQKPGQLPHITVNAATLPGAYELTLNAVWDHGVFSRTHYDQKAGEEYLHPPSKEATTIVNVLEPFKEPRMHNFIPGGYKELENYRQEVVEGIHDAWIKPGDTYWTYTYHERFKNWNPSVDLNREDRGFLLKRGINQIEKVVDDLVRDITSKGAQMTTWMPSADPGLESNRPCLQRMWFRAYELEDSSIGLNANWYFRSRDVKAWFMNFWALSSLHSHIADLLSERIQRPVYVMTESDGSDSLHFYGDFHKEFEARLKRIKTDENFKRNVFRSNVKKIPENERTPAEEAFLDETLKERARIEDNPHYNLNEKPREELAQRIAENPDAYSERDRQFVERHYPYLIIPKNESWFGDHHRFMDGGIK
ncbi:MAG: thymidylate synthase [Nanoarchaeota archaeon]|nr:thymidylate synthase [Nanoarchaeota archaeon]